MELLTQRSNTVAAERQSVITVQDFGNVSAQEQSVQYQRDGFGRFVFRWIDVYKLAEYIDEDQQFVVFFVFLFDLFFGALTRPDHRKVHLPMFEWIVGSKRAHNGLDTLGF